MKYRHLPPTLAITILALAGTIHPAAGQTADTWKEAVQEEFDEKADQLRKKTIRVRDSQPQLNLQFEWDGPVNSRGEAHGHGTLRWLKSGASGADAPVPVSRYEGEMKNGSREGAGEFTDASGARYIGEWQNNLKHGRGKYFLANGDYYEGEFQSDQFHGNGIYSSATGEIYEGSFENGKKHSETSESRPSRVNLTPEQGANRQGIRLALEVDASRHEKFLQEQHVEAFKYRSRYWNGEIQIEPESPSWKQWIERGYLHAGDEYALTPVFLQVSVANQSSSEVTIVGGTLDVHSSETDLEPVIGVLGLEADDLEARGANAIESGPGHDMMRFGLTNIGWGQASNCVLEFNLSRAGETPPSGTYQLKKILGTIKEALEVTFLEEFKKLGVQVDLLTKANSAELVTSQNARQVLGRFAKFNGKGQWIESNVMLNGRLSYSWKTAKGEERSRSIKMEGIHIRLDPRRSYEFGAAGPVDGKYQLLLRLDQDNYGLPFGFKKRLAAGANVRVALAVCAPKSSFHRFRVALKCSDGSTIVSPDCRMRFFLPVETAKSLKNNKE